MYVQYVCIQACTYMYNMYVCTYVTLHSLNSTYCMYVRMYVPYTYTVRMYIFSLFHTHIHMHEQHTYGHVHITHMAGPLDSIHHVAGSASDYVVVYKKGVYYKVPFYYRRRPLTAAELQM